MAVGTGGDEKIADLAVDFFLLIPQAPSRASLGEGTTTILTCSHVNYGKIWERESNGDLQSLFLAG